MALPKSFLAFQKIFESERLAEDQGQPRDVDSDGNPESNEEAIRLKKVLGFSTDSILSAMHSQEPLRDAIIDSFPNLANKTVLLVVNPSLNDNKALHDFLSQHPKVKRFVFGARKLKNGERIRAVKIDVVESDDEYGEPNKKDPSEEEEKDRLEPNKDEDQPLSKSFNFAQRDRDQS